MNADGRRLAKTLAFLLDYPSGSWRAELFDYRRLLTTTGEKNQRAVVGNFIAYSRGCSPVEQQEMYTAAFDLEPAYSLNLTYHLLGEGEERGKVLANLLRLYRQQGFDYGGGELPDYLPMVLEFLALCPNPEEYPLLRSCLGVAGTLAERLQEQDHPYAGLLGLAAGILSPSSAFQGEAMRQEDDNATD
ncbi:MAG: nitrate reductase molybdenum cofactor assembly chaperone [Desulfopila sp.]